MDEYFNSHIVYVSDIAMIIQMQLCHRFITWIALGESQNQLLSLHGSGASHLSVKAPKIVFQFDTVGLRSMDNTKQCCAWVL